MIGDALNKMMYICQNQKTKVKIVIKQKLKNLAGKLYLGGKTVRIPEPKACIVQNTLFIFKTAS